MNTRKWCELFFRTTKLFVRHPSRRQMLWMENFLREGPDLYLSYLRNKHLKRLDQRLTRGLAFRLLIFRGHKPLAHSAQKLEKKDLICPFLTLECRISLFKIQFNCLLFTL